MKKISYLFFLVVLFFYTGCAYNVVKIADDNTAILKLYNFSGQDNRLKSEYRKNSRDAEGKKIEVTFLVYHHPADDTVGETVYFQTAQSLKKYGLKVLRSKIIEKESSVTTPLGQKVTSYIDYREDTCFLDVPEDLRTLLLDSSNVKIQFYAGDKPIKFSLKEMDLKNIQKLILYKR